MYIYIYTIIVLDLLNEINLANDFDDMRASQGTSACFVMRQPTR